jgi:L-asparaginase II
VSADPAGTFTAGAAVELAVVERSGFIESRHIGSAVVIGADGAVLRSLGAPDAAIFPRSALKPFQAIGAMTTGLRLEGVLAAVAMGSHGGTERHVAAVRTLLGMAGLSEDALLCPPSWPADPAARTEAARDGEGPRPIFMACSGKHAAMLAACAASGWDTAGYLSPAHPLQVKIREVTERLTGEKAVTTGVDGCGTPVPAITLTALAAGFQRIASASTSSPFALYKNAATLREAARANSWAIDGPGRPDTIVTDRLGVFSKSGADGVVAVVAPDGTAVAVKVLDGSSRATHLVALELLAAASALSREAVDDVLPSIGTEVRGGGSVVGRVRLSPQLA